MSADNLPEPNAPLIEVTERSKLQLDYAWKYFDSASRQRMLFVNYFLIAVGVLANAYVLAMKEHLFPVAIFVSIFGLLASVAFIMLDHRMLVFVRRATSILETLERTMLFPDGVNRVGPGNVVTNAQLGMARTEPDARSSPTFETGYFLTKMWFLIRVAVEGSAAVGFLCGLIYAIVKSGCCKSIP